MDSGAQLTWKALDFPQLQHGEVRPATVLPRIRSPANETTGRKTYNAKQMQLIIEMLLILN